VGVGGVNMGTGRNPARSLFVFINFGITLLVNLVMLLAIGLSGSSGWDFGYQDISDYIWWTVYMTIPIFFYWGICIFNKAGEGSEFSNFILSINDFVLGGLILFFALKMNVAEAILYETFAIICRLFAILVFEFHWRYHTAKHKPSKLTKFIFAVPYVLWIMFMLFLIIMASIYLA
jgi:hypothetical protein